MINLEVERCYEAQSVEGCKVLRSEDHTKWIKLYQCKRNNYKLRLVTCLLYVITSLHSGQQAWLFWFL